MEPVCLSDTPRENELPRHLIFIAPELQLTVVAEIFTHKLHLYETPHTLAVAKVKARPSEQLIHSTPLMTYAHFYPIAGDVCFFCRAVALLAARINTGHLLNSSPVGEPTVSTLSLLHTEGVLKLFATNKSPRKCEIVRDRRFVVKCLP